MCGGSRPAAVRLQFFVSAPLLPVWTLEPQRSGGWVSRHIVSSKHNRLPSCGLAPSRRFFGGPAYWLHHGCCMCCVWDASARSAWILHIFHPSRYRGCVIEVINSSTVCIPDKCDLDSSKSLEKIFVVCAFPWTDASATFCSSICKTELSLQPE